MGYAVTAPLVIVADDTGQMHHVYTGGRLPANADEKHVQQLLDDGLVEKVEADADAPPADEAPKGNASREEWAAYAATKGAPEEETRPVDEGGLKQTELREKYGA